MKKTDFEVFDALMVDSQKCSDVSGMNSYFIPHVCRLGLCSLDILLFPLPLTIEQKLHGQVDNYSSPGHSSLFLTPQLWLLELNPKEAVCHCLVLWAIL